MPVLHKKHLEKENKKLKQQLSKAQLTIANQKEEIAQLRKDLETWPLELWDLIGNPVIIRASHNHRSEAFEVKGSDVICIFSAGRNKSIYLKEPLLTISGEERITSIINVNGSLAELMQMFGTFKKYFVKVSRSAIINVAYFTLNKIRPHRNILTLTLPEYQLEKAKRIAIENHCLNNFKHSRREFNVISKLQKRPGSLH